jgi:hypothetical protein
MDMVWSACFRYVLWRGLGGGRHSRMSGRGACESVVANFRDGIVRTSTSSFPTSRKFYKHAPRFHDIAQSIANQAQLPITSTNSDK